MNPKLSIVIPAFNEENYIARTIASLRKAIERYRRERNADAEIIVVDNNSTDRTAEVARQAGADVVVFEPENKISRARNAGAKVARGEFIAFCDADNEVTENLLVLIHDNLMDPKVVGGGTHVQPEFINWKVAFFYGIWRGWETITGAGVGMMHCRKVDFDAIGGYNEEMYAAEDVQFAYDLKKLGKKRGQKYRVIRDGCIITSMRKVQKRSFWQLFKRFVSFGFGLQRKLRSKEHCDYWYHNAPR